MLQFSARCVRAVASGQTQMVSVEVDGLSFAQRYLCSREAATLLGSRHRLCIISRPKSRSSAPSLSPAAATAAPQLWQRHWVIIEIGKVREVTALACCPNHLVVPFTHAGLAAEQLPSHRHMLSTLLC